MNPNPSLNSDEKKDNNFFVAPLATLSESEKEFPNISLISSNTENNNGKLSVLNKRYLKCTLNKIDDDFYLKNIPFELKNFEEDDSSEDIDSKVLTKIYDNNGHPWLYNNDLNSNKNILNNKRNREETKNLDNDNNDDKRLTDFFNQYVLKSINDVLKKSGYKFSFEALPQNFSEESQKNLFQLTLEDIFTKKDRAARRHAGEPPRAPAPAHAFWPLFQNRTARPRAWIPSGQPQVLCGCVPDAVHCASGKGVLSADGLFFRKTGLASTLPPPRSIPHLGRRDARPGAQSGESGLAHSLMPARRTSCLPLPAPGIMAAADSPGALGPEARPTALCGTVPPPAARTRLAASRMHSLRLPDAGFACAVS